MLNHLDRVATAFVRSVNIVVNEDDCKCTVRDVSSNKTRLAFYGESAVDK